MALETEIPYETLINLYLREYAGTARRLAEYGATASAASAVASLANTARTSWFG